MTMIAAYRGTSTISRAIQWQTRSPYSHVGWLCGDGSIVEAWHKGGVRRNADLGTAHTPGTVVDLFSVRDLGTWEEMQVVMFLESTLGAKYDFGSVLRFLTRRHESPRDRAKWFCSELVYAALASIGRPPLSRTEPWEVSPGLLVRSPHLLYVRTVFTAPPGDITLTHRPLPAEAYGS